MIFYKVLLFWYRNPSFSYITIGKYGGDFLSLADLGLNQKAVVKKICADGMISRRFQDIGLIPGCVVICVLISPLKDPKAFNINGTILAIRNIDAKNVEVEKI